jgi:hypothetical protein
MTGFSRSTCLVIFNQLLFSFEETLMPTLANIWTSTHALSHQLLSSGSNFHESWWESSLCDMIFLIFNISIARFYICIWSSARYNYSRNWREADRGRLWAYKWRFKQPLLVHTSLMICLLTYVPNPFCQLSLWEETGVPCGNPRLSAERWLLLFPHEDWVRVTLGKFSLRLEPATSEVKAKCTNHLATEAPHNIPSRNSCSLLTNVLFNHTIISIQILDLQPNRYQILQV